MLEEYLRVLCETYLIEIGLYFIIILFPQNKNQNLFQNEFNYDIFNETRSKHAFVVLNV